jgi:2-iminobutanoate/2-iminopropanoate deaminase
MARYILSFLSILTCAVSLRGQEKTVINSSDAPAAIGPYSQAIMVGNTLYCSGQIAIDPATDKMVSEGIQAETRQALKNLGVVLRAAGMGYADVVQATVYLADMNDFKTMNDIYAEYFKENPPARATVQVARLPRDARVEIACIAVKMK